MKRIGGAPSVSARVMGERGAAFSRAQGRTDRAEPAERRRQRRPRTGARRRPARGGHRRQPNAASARPPPRSRRPRSCSPRGCREPESPRPRKHFPANRLGAGVNTDFSRPDGSGSEGGAAARRRGALPGLRRRRRRRGDAEHGDLPGLLGPAGGLHPLDRDRRAAWPARLRGRLDHRCAADRRRPGLRRRRQGRRSPAPGPAPTSSSIPTRVPPASATGPSPGPRVRRPLPPRVRALGRPRRSASATGLLRG